MQGVALFLGLLPALIAAEAVVNPPSVVFSMDPEPPHEEVVVATANHSSQPPTTMLQEGKKIESWSPREPDLTQMQQSSSGMMPAYPPSMPNPQPFMPANYYLPGNQYSAPPGPPPTTEFRSDHYAYPFEPPSYTYPVSQPQVDSSLVPTARHFVIVSFIGLLLLFAIIQNSIAAARRKDALVEVLSNRRKRELMASSVDYDSMTPEVESALKEDARVRCIQRTLCYENRKLLEDLGILGKVLAKYLTRSVQGSLKEISPGWDRLVEDAANAGLRGEDCDVVYRDCSVENSSDSNESDEDEE